MGRQMGNQAVLPRNKTPNGPTFETMAEAVLSQGWPAGNAELGHWVDAMVAGEWTHDLAEAANLPLGIAEDPRFHTIASHWMRREEAPSLHAPFMATLLTVRGLQLQAQGKPEVFVDNLGVSLALARNLRNQSSWLCDRAGMAVERRVLKGLETWSEHVADRPDLLRRVLELLRLHATEAAPGTLEHRKADYLIARNSLDQVEDLLRSTLAYDRTTFNAENVRVMEFALVSFAWRVPWEEERHQRLLRAMHQGSPDEARDARRVAPRVFGILQPTRTDLVPLIKLHRCHLHAAQLQAALRLFQDETGRPATVLEELVPKYLPAIPLDPFDGKPFRYRLSTGEDINWPVETRAASLFAPAPLIDGNIHGPNVPGPDGGIHPAGGWPTRKVPAGQGILWSVGADGKDQGGHSQTLAEDELTPVETDMIFLVPLPLKK
jgi:hypothetical protein